MNRSDALSFGDPMPLQLGKALTKEQLAEKKAAVARSLASADYSALELRATAAPAPSDDAAFEDVTTTIGGYIQHARSAGEDDLREAVEKATFESMRSGIASIYRRNDGTAAVAGADEMYIGTPVKPWKAYAQGRRFGKTAPIYDYAAMAMAYGLTRAMPQPKRVLGHDGKPFPETLDAAVWADEFSNRFMVRLSNDTPVGEDTAGLMLGWFANAIEAGRAQGRRDVAREMRESVRYEIHPSPAQLDMNELVRLANQKTRIIDPDAPVGLHE